MTTPDGPLGGSLPQYALYRASDSWVAVAALEGHFWARLRHALDLPEGPDAASALSAALATRTASEWEEWARERDIPIAARAAPSKGQH
ncbi:CoA transferase [Dermacoccus nishinomiyaensis]|uniref:CoA transferase n=1 Tax=Dermacoccus nishinomiyaensis TaxID=1274 RepID=UPI001EF54F5D|nr:CoA transferase [Dermacoccus nishinomiyaensis]MCG7429086.1 CoA transferase [Dermacoccus nishinomiyaensis]